MTAPREHANDESVHSNGERGQPRSMCLRRAWLACSRAQSAQRMHIYRLDSEEKRSGQSRRLMLAL